MERASYNLNKVSDVKELLLNGSFGVKTLLGLVYLHNDIAAKLGYSIKEYKAASTKQEALYLLDGTPVPTCVSLPAVKSRWTQNIQTLKSRKKSIMKLIRLYCQATNQVADCEMGFRIAQIRGRSIRKPGQKLGSRVKGGLFGLNQKGLFVFSDPTCEENMKQVIIDSILRSE